MGSKSDSALVKNYCENHYGELFDFGYLSSHHFQMIEYNNLRMIVSRLEKQGILHKISKGIFIIGETSKDSYDVIIEHYTSNGNGMPAKEYLLFKLGIIDQEPKYKEIYSRLATGNKQIGNIKVIKNSSSFLKGIPANINLLIELISCLKLVKDVEALALTIKISELAQKYDNSYLATYVLYDYGRINFIKLESFLNSINISNEVMKIYETKIRNIDKSKSGWIS